MKDDFQTRVCGIPINPETSSDLIPSHASVVELHRGQPRPDNCNEPGHTHLPLSVYSERFKVSRSESLSTLLAGLFCTQKAVLLFLWRS